VIAFNFKVSKPNKISVELEGDIKFAREGKMLLKVLVRLSKIHVWQDRARLSKIIVFQVVRI